MTKSTNDENLPGQQLDPETVARRKLLKKLVWVPPAVIATASVRARAAEGTCNPANPCRPGP